MTYNPAEEIERLSKIVSDLSDHNVRIIRDDEDIKAKLINDAKAEIKDLQAEIASGR